MSTASSLPAVPRRSRRKVLTWTFLAFFLLPVFGALGALAYRGGPTHWSQWDRTVDEPPRRCGVASRGAHSGDVGPHARLEGRARGP